MLASGWELNKKKNFVKGGLVSNSSYAFIPFLDQQNERVIGHVLLVNPQLYSDQALEQALPRLCKVVGRQLESLTGLTEAKNLSYVDDLTDLYNQRFLKMVLDKEISRAQRSNQPFSVLFMDVDHFKLVNDTMGHVVGSKVLIEISKIILQNTRAVDYGFRYGGDEYLMLLVGNTSKQSLFVAERIRKQVEESTFDIDGVQIRVTISIGIACYPEHATSKEQIIEMADRAMYHGKAISRNVVYVAS